MSYNQAADSRRLVYLPDWARISAMAVSVIGLAVSLTISVIFTLKNGHEDKVVLAMSIAQISLGGLLFVIILFFSQRDENVDSLRRRSDVFLDTHVARALERVTIPDANVDRLSVSSLGEKDIFGYQYRLSGGKDFSYALWVGLNVHRVFVIYFLPVAGEPEDFIKTLRQIFAYTFGGAESVNYKVSYEHAVIDGESVVSIWLTAAAGHELLTDPAEKLFWAQDVAMMTASFLRTAHRAGVKLETRALPRSL